MCLPQIDDMKANQLQNASCISKGLWWSYIAFELTPPPTSHLPDVLFECVGNWVADWIDTCVCVWDGVTDRWVDWVVWAAGAIL